MARLLILVNVSKLLHACTFGDHINCTNLLVWYQYICFKKQKFLDDVCYHHFYSEVPSQSKELIVAMWKNGQKLQ